jgi:hypothetical protein
MPSITVANELPIATIVLALELAQAPKPGVTQGPLIVKARNTASTNSSR